MGIRKRTVTVVQPDSWYTSILYYIRLHKDFDEKVYKCLGSYKLNCERNSLWFSNQSSILLCTRNTTNDIAYTTVQHAMHQTICKGWFSYVGNFPICITHNNELKISEDSPFYFV